MIEHCISAFCKEQEEKAFKIYVTDALKILTENTAKAGGGNMLTQRYIDIINHKVETRTADEIVENIRNKLR